MRTSRAPPGPWAPAGSGQWLPRLRHPFSRRVEGRPRLCTSAEGPSDSHNPRGRPRPSAPAAGVSLWPRSPLRRGSHCRGAMPRISGRPRGLWGGGGGAAPVPPLDGGALPWAGPGPARRAGSGRGRRGPADGPFARGCAEGALGQRRPRSGGEGRRDVRRALSPCGRGRVPHGAGRRGGGGVLEEAGGGGGD